MTRRNFLLACIVSPFILNRIACAKSSTETFRITKSELRVLSRLARCIAEVETRNNDDVIGKLNERSRYQISRIVWNQHFPGRPFIECYGINAEECALRHLTWLARHFWNHSRKSVFWIAFAWNAGLERTKLEMRLPDISYPHYHFAERVENLYNDRNFK